MSLMQPKILYFTKYSRNAGSSRLRSFQYFPYLERAGFEVEVSTLFSENYLVQLYAGKSTFREAVWGYAKRFVKLFRMGSYDKIVIEKELFPYLPALAEYLLKVFGKKYVVDYDDAIFHNYDQSSNPIIKLFLSNKIDVVMKNAVLVVVGNTYLAARANKAGAETVEVIPTVVDLERYPVKVKTDEEKFVIGWIGTKSTFEKHLLPHRNWILKLQEDEKVEFHIVGITEDMNLGQNVKYIPWTEATEVANIHRFDIGIMPLQDSLWEKGKCSYKIIQYFASGIPAIASPVGMNKEVVKEGISGVTATNEHEWLAAIKNLMKDDDKRQAFGQAGRKSVEKQFALQVTAAKWVAILTKDFG